MNNIFKTSINIKYDMGKEEFFKRYIPTAAHSEILKGILDGINNEGSRSHIAIGPYGTGKSLISTLIASMVSKSVNEEIINDLIKKFSKSDSEISSKILKLKKAKTIVPIIINGYEGDFEEVLINKLVSELKKYKIKIQGTHINTIIFDTITNWGSNYPLLYATFLAKFQETEYKLLDDYFKDLLNDNKKSVDWFLDIYPLLTGGNTFASFGDQSFISICEDIFEQSENQGVGLFIIYDEFGRYLQTLPENKIEKTMGILQDLAECIDHKTKYSSMLLITHKHLSNYFVRYSEELKNEFNRIEKRFKIYSIKNDQETFFDIANEIIVNYELQSYNEQYIEKQLSMIRKFGIFDNNQVVIENKIIKGCFPIHPVSIYLLIKLSSLYGQNERTLFTFLESEESGGLLNHIKNNQNLYLPYKLFDYFFSNYNELNFDDVPDSVKMFYKLERKIEVKQSHRNILINILKFMTIWEETNSNSRQKLTEEFLSYVFDKNIMEYLLILKDLKLIRLNRLLNKWEFFEGSPIDINKKINDVKTQLLITKEDKYKLLNDLLPIKYIFPNQYNHLKSMTRFARNKIISANDIITNNYEDTNFSDFKIYFIFKDENSIEEIVSKLQGNNSQFSLFCLTNYNELIIDEYIKRWFCLDYLLKDKEFYNQNINLKDELYIEIVDTEHEIVRFLDKIFEYSKKDLWYYQNKKIKLLSQNELSNFLSNRMNEIYRLTPEIKNDMFNRINISNQQLNAAKNLINHIIKYPLEKDFNIKGSGPDYLIYATIFKNNNFLSDLPESEISDLGLKELYNKISQEIVIKKRQRFIDLINIFMLPPFGIRKPVVPVLLVGILKNKWNYMMFFSKGSFIPNVNSDALYDMIEHPEDFEYIVFEYDESFTNFFEHMSKFFEEFSLMQLYDKPLHIQVAASMLKWLQALPKITQTTSKLERDLLEFRELIKKIEIDPYQIFKEFKKEHESKFEVFGLKKLMLDSYFSNYLHDLELKISNKFVNNDIKEWVKLNIVNYPDNILLKILEQCDYELVIEELSQGLIGVTLIDWTELTETIFFNEFDKQLKEIISVQFDPNKHIMLSIDNNLSIIHKNIDLTTKGELIVNNIYRILDTQGKFISKEELDYIIYMLIQKYIN